MTVLAKREGQNIHFSLKEGVGHWVGKAPWLIEWGGGASVESPHFQRVHYCQLLVSDFLMRLKCKRFPPIEKDMKVRELLRAAEEHPTETPIGLKDPV